ncbi:unnamed protein product [Vitrella brassicaformis CCMP3155]|uniref:FYVE-type domain-containing protein n=1 Tax=Vitrella brassicaformis (strain CCMP3155) TaxID=1169540 RepID=A0A0G4FUP4_VITBC|nr:unnamed protein product [Vitrella brassicaformis CCMP3155]|eukprot:CEM18449.1 unnamed protein product [Vitrella brassicaformis CCMP3155]
MASSSSETAPPFYPDIYDVNDDLLSDASNPPLLLRHGPLLKMQKAIHRLQEHHGFLFNNCLVITHPCQPTNRFKWKRSVSFRHAVVRDVREATQAVNGIGHGIVLLENLEGITRQSLLCWRSHQEKKEWLSALRRALATFAHPNDTPAPVPQAGEPSQRLKGPLPPRLDDMTVLVAHDLVKDTVHAFALENKWILIQEWIQHAVNRRGGADIGDLNDTDEWGWSAAHVAARVGSHAAMTVLVDGGVDVDGVSAQGETPLLVACRVGNAKIVRLLLRNGANPRAVDKGGRNVVYLAASHPSAKVAGTTLKVLRMSHVNLNGCVCRQPQDASSTPHLSALHVAILNHDVEMVGRLLSVGCDANIQLADGSGRTAVHLAVQTDHQLLVQSVLEFGGQPNLRDAEGLSPLHHCRSLECVIVLVEYGARGWEQLPNQIRQQLGLPLEEKDGEPPTEEAAAALEAVRSARQKYRTKKYEDHRGERISLPWWAVTSSARWTNDADVDGCQACGVTFTVRIRRHHCRSCGLCVCDECSSKRAVVPHPCKEPDRRASGSQQQQSSSPDGSPTAAAGGRGRGAGRADPSYDPLAGYQTSIESMDADAEVERQEAEQDDQAPQPDRRRSVLAGLFTGRRQSAMSPVSVTEAAPAASMVPRSRLPIAKGASGYLRTCDACFNFLQHFDVEAADETQLSSANDENQMASADDWVFLDNSPASRQHRNEPPRTPSGRSLEPPAAAMSIPIPTQTPGSSQQRLSADEDEIASLVGDDDEGGPNTDSRRDSGGLGSVARSFLGAMGLGGGGKGRTRMSVAEGAVAAAAREKQPRPQPPPRANTAHTLKYHQNATDAAMESAAAARAKVAERGEALVSLKGTTDRLADNAKQYYETARQLAEAQRGWGRGRGKR